MEVHAHPHPPPGSHQDRRKKWIHYFWEFLMLFLAVFFGFFAEYRLEHKIERDREKQYMKSLIEDLKNDTSQINLVISLFSLTIRMEDSLKNALLKPGVINDGSNAYPFVGYPLMGYFFERSEGTIQQLKNAGGFRLVHSIAVTNKINKYDEVYRRSEVINVLLRETYLHYLDVFNRVVNAELIKVPYEEPGLLPPNTVYKWNTTDPGQLKTLYNSVKNMQWLSKMYIDFVKILYKRAAELIEVLTKEYE